MKTKFETKKNEYVDFIRELSSCISALVDSMITKKELDKLAEKYETADFIKDDPIQFAYKGRGKSKEDIELYGFISSLFAYGNRKIFMHCAKK